MFTLFLILNRKSDYKYLIYPCGSMVERLTTNQEAAGSSPAKDEFLKLTIMKYG